MLTIYGISNCDKCRSARRWFKAQAIEHRFHDLREDGTPKALVQRWLTQLTADELLNKRSPTWRSIPESDRGVTGAAAIIALVKQYPTVIKRPVVDDGHTVCVGYDEAAWKKHF